VGEEGREAVGVEVDEEEDERERRGEVGGVQSFLRVVWASSSCSSSEFVVFHPRLRGEEGMRGARGGVVEGGRGVSGRAVQGSSKSLRRQKPRGW
jgi:hypothetical protein